MIPLFIAAIVSLTNEFGMARIDTFGANVLSYVPVGGREVFFRQAEERRTNQWYHGGVPVCWPWFGRYGDPGSALHGFAWSRDWAVDKVENGKRMSKAVLRLERKDEFRLTYEIRLEDELSLCLSMRNLGRDKFVVTTGFHPYFSVSHPKNITVATAQGPIRCHEAMDGGRPFGAGTYRISDSGLSRGIELKSFGNNKLVIWNIGPDEVQPGLSPTDWQKYICVEPVVSPRCDGFYLQPGRSCDIGMSCRVVNDDCGAVGGIGWIDLNKNGIRDVYEDPSEPVDRRVADLLGRMTLEEKTCQLATLYGSGRVLKDYQPTAEWKNALWKDGIANIDEELNGVGKCRKERPELVCPFSNHVAAVRNIQRWFVEETRLGIPVDFSNEGIHGLNHTKATPLPAPIGIGSTWNRALVREAGEIVGREAKLIGYSNVYAPILDVARDPRWGRMLECYGEDPYLVGTLGAEMCAGIQSQGVASTLKHYAVYGVPKGGRDGECRTDPHVTPRELHEIFLAPFRRVIQSAHPMGVMCSYNDWNGEPIAASRYFLSDLLRDEYGFDGYVVSDSEAVEYVHTKHAVAETPGDAVRMVLEAGLNVRTHFSPPEDFVRLVREQVGRGCLPMSIVDQRVAEVLSVKFRLGLFDNPYLGDAAKADAEAGMAHHLDFADRIQGESFVLLKNDGTLPIRKTGVRRILVTGPLADERNYMTSRYGPNGLDAVTIRRGVADYLSGAAEVVYEKGCETVDPEWPDSEIVPTPLSVGEEALLNASVAAAKESDVIVAVLGEDEKSCGEGRSRTSLELPGRQQVLLDRLLATGKPVVVVLVNGRALTINEAERRAAAILETWLPGCRGGRAVARTLFGEVNPSGKLTVTFPKSVGQVEYNFPYKKGAHGKQSKWVENPNGSGHTRVEGPLYPFGHGLSYTRFDYSNLVVEVAGESDALRIFVSCDVTNVGRCAGAEVVQLYVRDEYSSVVTYDSVLRGFEKVFLDPGESKRVAFTLKPEDLAILDRVMKWAVEPGGFEVRIGSSSEDLRLRGRFLVP